MMLLAPVCAMAQKTVDVTAKYTYTVGDNDDITLKEAKRKCMELARAEAIRVQFGELITSDVIDANVETNGEPTSSYFWENTVAKVKGDWLGDTREPMMDVRYVDGKLEFTAEVWGTAREIIQAKTEFDWKILRDTGDRKLAETKEFSSGERIYVSFRSPASGYVAVYLIVGDDETSCLLPYRSDETGRFAVRNGRTYTFFDREEDPNASYYRLNTQRLSEDNQVVIIYSPNPFTKCNDITGDARHPNSLSTHDFQKWLLKCQRADKDMVVDKKWVRISNLSERE